MGSEAEKVFVQLTFAEREVDQYDKVLEKLDDYFTPKVNIVHECSIFHRRDQGPDENIECCVRALHDLSVRAQFPNRDEAIQDRLVLGVKDKEFGRTLQMKPGLMIKMAVDLARQREAVLAQIQQQRQTAADSVDAVNRSYSRARGGIS